MMGFEDTYRPLTKVVDMPAKPKNLELRVTEMIVDLVKMKRQERYKNLLFADHNDKQSVRATMHYVMALSAYGLSADDDEVRDAVKWFKRRFPKQRNDDVDVNEMNRLMVLLRYIPYHESVQSRLIQLSRQRGNDGHYDVQPGWPEFDSLWALEAFTSASLANVLPDNLITVNEIKAYLDKLIKEEKLERDKDYALGLRLHYDLFGQLDSDHKEQLKKLIAHAKHNDGFWGMQEFGWRIHKTDVFRDLCAGNSLTASSIQPNYRPYFRKIILSTCMVIEYLTPIAKEYPELQASLERAMLLWWKQFEDQDSVAMLKNIFPNPYDYILILSRTLRAIRAYMGNALSDMTNAHLLRELIYSQRHDEEAPEKQSIKKALRAWLDIELSEPIKPLKLGFSDASVVRVKPYINSPLHRNDDEKQSLVQYSLIIKYGPSEMIDAERASYEKIPGATNECFVSIPETSYKDPDTGLSYVVMQDLREYSTLYELQNDQIIDIATIGNELSSFLQRMHNGGTTIMKPVPDSMMREVYLSRMIEYIDRVFNFLWEHHLFEQQNEKEIRDIQYEMFDHIGTIIRNQRKLEKFPVAQMHGDLHMRNIMVHRSHSNGARFKLIDLEFMRLEGDAAFDAGQLLVDLELVSREPRTNEESEIQLNKLRSILEADYLKFGEKRDDDTFPIRVTLAKARALLRIAKGMTKRGTQAILDNRMNDAQDISDSLIAQSFEALEFLRYVVEDAKLK